MKRKPTDKTVKRILDLCFKYNIYIVSHGLAPNPDGFCFERDDNTPLSICKSVSALLECLNKEQVNELKLAVFGGA